MRPRTPGWWRGAADPPQAERPWPSKPPPGSRQSRAVSHCRVFPFQKNKVLIGTSGWEGDLGFGVIRGFGWGTVTGRAALSYDGEDSRVEFGEYAFEYLKRLSPSWRVVATIEAETEDVSAIGEAQWHFSERGFLKLNCGFGLTAKAPDIAPEVGILFRF